MVVWYIYKPTFTVISCRQLNVDVSAAIYYKKKRKSCQSIISLPSFTIECKVKTCSSCFCINVSQFICATGTAHFSVWEANPNQKRSYIVESNIIILTLSLTHIFLESCLIIDRNPAYCFPTLIFTRKKKSRRVVLKRQNLAYDIRGHMTVAKVIKIICF